MRRRERVEERVEGDVRRQAAVRGGRRQCDIGRRQRARAEARQVWLTCGEDIPSQRWLDSGLIQQRLLLVPLLLLLCLISEDVVHSDALYLGQAVGRIAGR